MKTDSAGSYVLNIKLFLIWLVFSIALILPALSKYLALHTHFWDMGTYQNFLWNYSFSDLSDILVFSYHFRPILFIFAVFYKLFPYGETLLILQSISISIAVFPLYAYARDILGRGRAYRIVYLYCFFSPVWFINLSDFHPDSLIIPLALFALYFLKNKRYALFAFSVIMLLAVKEISFFIVAFIGIYAIVRYRQNVLGYSLFILTTLTGVLVIDKLIPYFGGKTPIELTGVSWLGNDMAGLLKTIFLNPKLILTVLINYWKAIYIIVLFGSFLFIPLLAPLELLPAIPGISFALLSDLWRQYALVYQYPSTVVPFIFIAFIEGFRRAKVLKVNNLKFMAAVFILVNFLYFGFYLLYKNDSYHFSRYIITSRDNEIRAAIEKYVPNDTSLSVSTSNLINYSRLANRKNYLEFPKGVIRPYDETMQADFAVFDLYRIKELKDIMSSRGNKPSQNVEQKFSKIYAGIEKAFLNYNTIYEYDGFYILRRKQ